MMRRREMLFNMAGGIPDFLEEVDSFNCTEQTNTHTFSYDGTRALYVVLRKPLLTENQLINYPSLPGSGEFYALSFYVTGVENNPALRSGVLLTLRPNFANQQYLDYWGLIGVGIGTGSQYITDNSIYFDLNYSARNYFEAGYTYTLYRFKKFAD